MNVKPSSTTDQYATLSIEELRNMKPTNMGNKVVCFDETHFGALTAEEFRQAMSFHGLNGRVEDDQFGKKLILDLNTPNHQKSMEYIKSAPNTFTGGVHGYGFGKEPQMLILDNNNTAIALEALQQAHKDNTGITQQNADTLLQWIAQKSKNAIFSNGKTTSPQAIRGSCGFGQGLVGHQCEQMGIDVKYHQAAELSDFSIARHGFNVVTLPTINEAGISTDTHYLVDTTFRQFFVSDGRATVERLRIGERVW
jgi:hypothetical protein